MGATEDADAGVEAYNRLRALIDEAQIAAAFGGHEAWAVEQSDLGETQAFVADSLAGDPGNLVGPLKPGERIYLLRRPDPARPGRWAIFACGCWKS